MITTMIKTTFLRATIWHARLPHCHLLSTFAILAICAFNCGCSQTPVESPADVETPSVESTTQAEPNQTDQTDVAGGTAPDTPAAVDAADPAPLLMEITKAVGLEDAEADWPDGFYLTPEITPGGVALFDYDNDGDLDIYQVCHCQPIAMPNAFRSPAPNRLFRQNDDGSFTEVENAAGLADAGYGHGAAVGDIDNDGDPDVFVTNYGFNSFFLNNGDGTFTDSTKQAGFSQSKWSSAAAFVDFDLDGFLDLIVVHFATFDTARQCGGAGDTEQDYCGPHLFDGMADQLYRNNGDGTFRDVSDAAGIKVPARGWGVIATDLTEDGWPDIYVCNDEEPNQLWINQGDGTFADEAVFRGAAFNGVGRPEASMGVTLGDVDRNGKLDLFMTHVTSETNTLYTLDDQEYFNDTSSQCGTAAVDLAFTGWGCGFLDLDHDGDLDLAVANGRVASGPVDPASKHSKFWNRYAEQNFLFLNDGSGKFENASRRAGTFASRPEVTRGMAFGDLDNDGDIDVVTNDLANRLRIFRNLTSERSVGNSKSNWLQIRAEANGRVDIGAFVTVETADQRLVQPVLRSYSYLASNDPRTHFGLGEISEVKGASITWSDGMKEDFSVSSINQTVVLKKGDGTPGK